MLTVGVGNAWGTNVVFTFNTTAGLKELGITEPSKNSTTVITSDISKSVITITPYKNNASSKPVVRKSNDATPTMDLRLYKKSDGTKGASIKISVSGDNKLTGISGLWTSKVAATNGTLSSGSWTPTKNSTTTEVEIYNNSTASSGTASGCTVITVSYESTVSCTSITPSLSYASVGGTTLVVGSTSSGSPTVSGNTGSGAVTYSVTAASPAGCATVNSSTGVVTAVAAGTATITASIAANGGYCSGSATANFTITNPTYTVGWQANGTDWTGAGHGTPSTSVVSGNKVTTLPTAPTSAACDGSKVFVGWTATQNYSNASTPPGDLFTTTAGAPTVTANVTYYAVFANAEGSDPVYTKVTSVSAGTYVMVSEKTSSTYKYMPNTTSDNANPSLGSGITMSTTAGVTTLTNTVTDAMLWDFSTGKTSGYFYVRPHGSSTEGLGTLSSTGAKIRIGEDYVNEEWRFKTSASYGWEIDNGAYYLSAYSDSEWRNYGDNSTNQNGTFYLFKQSGGMTYSNYATTCCTKLGSINGSISLTQGGNSVTISGWSDVSNVGTYTVKMYKKNGGGTWDLVSGSASGGSAGTEGTRTGITSGSKSVTYTGLEVESEYKFTVQTIAGSASYCDGDETAVTEINSTDVSSTPFKFRYSIYMDNGSGSGWAHHYITPTANANEGSVTIDLNAHVDYYQFKIAGGFSGWWGQTTNDGKIEATTVSDWTLDGDKNVRLKTGAAGDYVFTVDYSGTTNPKVGVEYPSADQNEGYVIYYDNSVLNWSNLYYRIGNNSSCSKVDDVALVPGTDKFYKVTTPDFNSMDAWHIANNYGWTGSNSIYRTKTDDSQSDIAITNSINFQQYVVTEDITVIPTTTHSTGGDDQNNNCEFYTINTPTSGMLTHNVAVGSADHGTVVATYTNTSGTTGQTVEEGANADLAHRCIVTITATPDAGYQLSSLTVNGAAFTSGNEHILAADATIAATFTAQTSTVTLDNNDATSGSQQTVSATYDAAMPLTTTSSTSVAALSRTGYTFTGWWDATSDGTQYYSYNAGTSTLSSARTWNKTGAQTLKAQWSINSYTLTWAWGGGSTSAASGEDYTAAGSVAYNTALEYPANNTMSRNGYTFTGWSSSATNMPAEALTITAQWEAKQYTVTLDNKSATTSGSTSVTATFDAILPTIIPPTKDGYRFDGYWTEASGGAKYINADGTGATAYKKYSSDPATHKLHAHWVAQLTFTVNGVADGTLTRDDNTALPSTATVPAACGDCWAFMGWSTDAEEDGAPAYAGGDTHEFGSPTTLYAVFGKAEYKLIKSTSELVANDYYVVASSTEWALSNADHSYYTSSSYSHTDAASTDISSISKSNANGYYIYNPPTSIIWKFSGTKDAGQLQNVATPTKYVNLTATNLLSTAQDLKFSVSSDGESWIIQYSTTNFLHGYTDTHGNGFETLSSSSWEDDDYSAFLYRQISAEYATEPNCETYDIVWKVDGTPLSSGSQTEETNECTGIEDLPTDPDDDELDCATKFVGWSEQELVGNGHDAPADLFTAIEDAPIINEDKLFHAVFATSIGTPIAAIEDDEFSSKDESGGYCNATYSFKATGKYLQNQSIWTSSNMTNVKVRIRIYHVSNGSADVLRVSLINSSGAEVVGADLTTSKLGSNITSAGGWSNIVELTPTTAVTGYKVSMKTKNSSGTGINKIEREVVASGLKDYMTECCEHIVTLSDGSPANGTVTFDPAGSVETCTGAKEVSMTITPNPGYYLSGWSSSGVAPTSVVPAVVTNTADAQTTTLTFAEGSDNGTYTAGATFTAKALEGWTWMYKKDADVADNSVDPYEIPDVVEIYKDQYARFIITGYAPADVIAEKQGYVYTAGGVEPAYTTSYLTWVANTASYFTLKGKNPVESTTITFKAIGDASITRTMTIRVKALPLVHFVDNVHNVAFDDVVATVETGVVTLTKKTPTQDDFDGTTKNTCEETHLHLVGWIDGDWTPYQAYMNGTGEKPTVSAIIGATGYFYAPNVDIDLVAKDGKTFYAVWANVE